MLSNTLTFQEEIELILAIDARVDELQKRLDRMGDEDINLQAYIKKQIETLRITREKLI